MKNFADSKVRPVDWLIEEFFPRKTVSLIVAPTGVGKSMIGLHLALSILAGRPWLGFPCLQGAIGYWDQDNPDLDLTENRICALAKGMGIEIPRNPPSLLFRTKGRIDTARDLVLEKLIAIKAVALFVDTFAAVNPFNENDANLMSQVVVDYFFPFVEAGISVIPFHHPAKEIHLATKRQLLSFQRQGANASRGSTGLPAACGTVFNLVRDQQGSVSLVAAKPRYGNPPILGIAYDEDGEMGTPDWTISIKPARPHASVESAVAFLDEMDPAASREISSRQLVGLMTDSGYYMTQSTASRALKSRASQGGSANRPKMPDSAI